MKKEYSNHTIQVLTKLLCIKAHGVNGRKGSTREPERRHYSLINKKYDELVKVGTSELISMLNSSNMLKGYRFTYLAGLLISWLNG